MGDTIAALLQKAAALLADCSDSARLDAEILLSHALGKSRTYLRAWPERTLEADRARYFLDLLEQRRHGVPIAYLTGRREFWSREFRVSPDVLIPRHETERLIEICLELVPSGKPAKLIDLGTGSGIIAITLACERPLAEITATDINPAALAVAGKNAEAHGVRLRFLHSNWFSAVPSEPYDLVVSNPPYIAENDAHLEQGDLRFEPLSALAAPDAGLADIQTLARDARGYLKSGGHLLIEHGCDQEAAVQSIFRDMGYDSVTTLKDLSGQPRTTYGQYP